MTTQAGSVEVEFRTNLDPLKQGMAEADKIVGDGAEQITRESSGLKKVFDGIGEKAKEEFGEFADNAIDAFDRATDSASDLHQTLSSIGTSLKGIGFGALKAGATAATASLVKMAKAGVSDTSALENTQIQMMGLTHSIQAGNKAMAMAVQYYKNNPFNRFEVTDATKNLIQFGASLEEIPDLLDQMGKVSLSTGAKIDQLAYIYQRMTSDGRVNTLDLLQLQTQGVAIFDALGKRLNTTATGVRELVAQGKVSAEDVKEAFKTLVDDDAMEQFQQTLARQVDRAKGRLSDLRGAIAGYYTDVNQGVIILEGGIYKSWTKFLKTFADVMTSAGDSANPAGKSIIEGFQKISLAIGKVIDQLTKFIEPALTLFGKLLNFVGDNAEVMIPIIGTALMTFTKVSTMLPGIGPIIGKVSGYFDALNIDLKKLIKNHWGLIAVVGILVKGFIEAYKTDEEFKKTIQDLLGALSELGKSLGDIVRTILPTLVELFNTLARSDAVKGILQAVAGALSGIAKAIASIPADNLAMIISFFVSFKLLKTNPILLAVSAIALLIGYIQQLAEQGENLPEKLLEMGHNMMVGLLNGIIEGAKKVFKFIQDFANTIVNTFKSLLKIHSPSQVFYEIGEMIPLGLAEGIEDNSNVAQVAMNNLAKDILALSTKIIKNKVDFGILDIKQEYQEWKKVSKLFTVGSEQYNQAIENMEDARKSANLKILDLQRDYNEALDNTIDRISRMYGLFDEVNLTGGKNAGTILKNLDQQVAKMQEWSEAQKMITGLNLDETLKAELAAMGVAEVGELESIANMTADELATLNDMWLQKQKIANEAGIEQMDGYKNETLDKIRDIKDGIDGETVDIEDAGGRLIEHIGDGITGAMPTLESAYAQLNDYIAQAQKQLAKTLSGEGSNVGGGDTGFDVPDAGQQLLDGIQGNIEKAGAKFKEMLPKILLGMVGAWGLSKILPKVFSTISKKIDVKGAVSGALSGLFGRAAEGRGKGAIKDALNAVLDDIDFNTDEGTLKSKIVDKIKDKLNRIQMPDAMEETVKKTSKATKPAQTIADTSAQISTSMQQTSKSFSKVDGVLDTIKKGAQTIIWIAGAIAAVAAALWVTYNLLKDIDFGKLALQLIAMGLAVAEFGALAFLAEKFVDTKGILLIAGLAADLAIAALACRAAYELMSGIDFLKFQLVLLEMAEALVVMGALATVAGLVMDATLGTMALGMLAIAGLAADIMIAAVAIRLAYETMLPIDFDKFQVVILEMAEAIGVFGALSAALGALIVLEFLGWASVLMICDELVKVSQAIVEVDNNVPEDFKGVEQKIKNIKWVLEQINGADLGTVIGMMVTSWTAEPAERIISMYLKVAKVLNELSSIELDKAAIEANLDYVKATLESIQAKTDVISGWLEASALDMEASTVENAGRIVIVYGNMVDALNKLSDFSPDEEKITASLLAMVGVITLLRNQSYGNGGLFNIFNNMDTIANDVDKIKGIVKNYLEMVPTFQDLGLDDNQISDDTKEKVEKNIGNIKSIVTTIGQVDTGGWIDQKESDMSKIQSILNKYTELEPVIWQISQFNLDYIDGDNGAKKKIQKIREMVLEIGKVDTGGWIDQKESDMNKIQSILNKFTEIAKTCGLLAQYPVPDTAQGWIQTVRHLVWEIGQINQDGSGDLDNKINIIEKSKTIATKLSEFAGIIKDLESTDKGGVIESLTSALNQLISGVNTTLNERSSDIEKVGSELGQALARGISSQAEAMTNAGNSLQSALWWAIDNKKMDEYYQGQDMANHFGNGLKSVNFDAVGQAIQSSVWWGIQNRMGDEYWQGQAMGEQFRQGLYAVDYGNAGWWAIQGFINGAWGRTGAYDGMYNTGRWVTERFLQGIKDRGQQGSPWKTTMESGNWAIEGLIDGIKQEEKALVNEATNLADEVVEALTMDDLTLSPELDAHGSYTPTMDLGSGYSYGNNGNVIIEQTNNNYTQYDIEQVQRDLAWELSKV